MKTDLSLLYDEDCPLCRWYTGLFVKHSFLAEKGKIPYTAYIQSHPGTVDETLARNKIACVNNQTGEVCYGVDSLLLILGQRFPFIRTLGEFKPINVLLKLLYLFISYNRKVIVPAPKKDIGCACEPTKSILWRTVFIVVISLLTSVTIHWYFGHFLSDYVVWRAPHDLILLTAQIGFQGLVFLLLHQKNGYDYLGHLVFVSFLGSLLLLFFGIGIRLMSFTGMEVHFLAVVCYGITIACMFFEHKRRTGLNDWTWKLSLSWVLFRVAIYPLVFQF